MATTRLKSSQVTHQTAGGPQGRTLYDKLTEFVSVQDFGALGDGLTDDAPAIQKAINSGMGRIYFPSGTYMIGAGGLTGSSNQAWVGDGRARTFLKMKVTPALEMVYFHTKSNFSIEGITFDGNGLLKSGSGNFPTLLPCIHVSVADNFYVRDCGFSGFYNCGLLMNVVNNATIERNYVDRGSALTTPNHGIVVSGSVGGGESYLVTIRGNKCDHCQISIHAYNCIVSGNIVTGWGFSAGINTQATAASHDLVISDNICYNSNQNPDSSPYLPAGIENWAPNSTITGNICYGNFGDGIDNGGASCIIADNICYNNMGYGIYNLYQTAALNASNSLVTGNLLHDNRPSQSRTQIAGYAEQGGGLSGIAFADNVCRNNVGSNVYDCADRISAAQYDWIVPTFQNNWTNFGDNSRGSAAGYYRDANGIVRLRGLIRTGIVPSIAFYLPVGFRPSNPLYFPVVSNAAFGLVLISWGGDVEVHTGDSTWVSLDSIAFRAAD